MTDLLKHRTVFTIQKFSDRAHYRQGQPFARSVFEKNVLLNEGITELQQLLTGSTLGRSYAQANAYLGVGDSTASSGVATSTGLLSTANTLYVQVSTGYPTLVSQTTTWRSVFSSAQANFAWREFTLSNRAGSTGDNLNRRVSNQGTKVAGQTWTLDLAITWS